MAEQNQNPLPPKITKENFDVARGVNKDFSWIKTVVYLLISSFLLSFAAKTLITPNSFTIGGVSGIGILVNVASKGAIPQSWVLFGLNFPLILLAFFFVKKKFAILTAIHIGLQTVWLLIFETLFPDFVIQFASNGEKIFAALASGICIGTALALAFKLGGCTGGGDVVAVLIQRKLAASSIAWMLFAVNFAVVSASLFVFYDPSQPIAYNLLPIMMSAFELYVESKINESITNGFQSAIEFRIITDKPDEMAQTLMRELSRGVTMLPATGMYTKQEHPMLLCVISRRQVATLRKVIKTVDPDSFAVMTNVSQVLGLGFFTNEI